jgi:hypothetical protein
MDRDKQLKQMHTEARKRLVRDLIDYAGHSQDGGEYFISVNGMRIWLSSHEVSMLLSRLDTHLYNSCKPYGSIVPDVLVID